MGEDYRMKFEKYKKDKSKLESFRPKNPFDSRQICDPCPNPPSLDYSKYSKDKLLRIVQARDERIASDASVIEKLANMDTVSADKLRTWCEDHILALELEEELCHYDYGVIFAYKDILNKFCGGEE
jgi:hypothetical protein